MNGHLVRTGGMELVTALEERGYDWLAEEAAIPEGSRT
jgi:Fe-S cluster assembly ATPase SufC